jgi:hypothetical protein
MSVGVVARGCQGSWTVSGVLVPFRVASLHVSPSENHTEGHRSISRQIRLPDANWSDSRFWNNIDEVCEHVQWLRTRSKPVQSHRFSSMLIDMLLYGTNCPIIFDYYCNYNSPPMDRLFTIPKLGYSHRGCRFTSCIVFLSAEIAVNYHGRQKWCHVAHTSLDSLSRVS